MIIKQKGIALFQVLVTITILIGIFSVILSKQVRLQAKISTSIILMQFEQVELSSERMVMDFLQQDRTQLINDGFGYDWPLLLDQPIEGVLGASIDYSIYPLDGMWSINLLYQNNMEDFSTSPIEMLIKATDLDEQDTQNALTDDWDGINFSDPDTGEIRDTIVLKEMFNEISVFSKNSQISGSNFDYEEPYYLKSGLPLADLSEILLVSDRDNIQRLALLEILTDNFSVLPVKAKLNINEASSRVLASIHSDITDGIIKEIIQITDSTGFKSIDAFLNLDSMNEFKNNIPKRLLSVNSEYFVARILVTMPTDNDQEPIERMRDVFIYRPMDPSQPVQIYQRKFVPL
ncbi:MAG: general secretion pathway protein GspK [Saccharospirillaceae bacterium]|nr:type II secretion system protein GspK [Pseudomonadales bacterium]NRB81153.1 general secretion pathway protein GspK [Saccharospirillaceae bacterium]